jgi:hypothetical protein
VSGQLDDIFLRERSVDPNGVAIDGESVGDDGARKIATVAKSSMAVIRTEGGIVVGEFLSADDKGDGQCSERGNGGGTDREDDNIVEPIAITVVVGEVQDRDLENDEDTHGDETEGTN